MQEFFNTINHFSGLLTFLSFIGASLWFIFSLKAKIVDVKETAIGIKKDYTIYKTGHSEQTRQIKAITYEIRDKINEQNIHQEYLRKISEDSTKAINRMNDILNQLSNTLTEIGKRTNWGK